MPMSTWALASIAFALLTLGLGFLLAQWWSRFRSSAAGASANRAGKQAEKRAEKLLKRAGYHIITRQPVARWALLVDGAEVSVRSHADLLVNKGGKTYIAEVKSGIHGCSPTSANTRRQLLEYARVFGVHGVLLVDMRHERVHQVQLP